MVASVPRTVIAVSTSELIRLQEEAAALGLNARAPVDLPARHLDDGAAHYLDGPMRTLQDWVQRNNG